MREITCVSMDITTHCDRRCPNCCCGIGINRKLQHHPWKYFEDVAPFLQGIDRVNLTGGEPTLHPEFATFVPRFRELFGCKRLTLSTDGFRIEQYRQIIEKEIDEVHFSDYGTRPGALETLYQLDVDTKVYEAGMDAQNFVSRERRGGGGPCARGFSETVAFADGKFYPCCVSPGLDGTKGLLPCADWRTKVQELDMGCTECFFSI